MLIGICSLCGGSVVVSWYELTVSIIPTCKSCGTSTVNPTILMTPRKSNQPFFTSDDTSGIDIVKNDPVKITSTS
jgi:hypothetical protein